jgi:hypothetical protein
MSENEKQAALQRPTQTDPTTSPVQPQEKRYVMIRRDGEAVALVEGAGPTHELVHVVRHSPTGVEFGYGGSGPADLARSILTDAVGPEIADQHYQDFKWDFVARLVYQGGVISISQIHEWLKQPGGRT